jgi:hypothetical protein
VTLTVWAPDGRPRSARATTWRRSSSAGRRDGLADGDVVVGHEQGRRQGRGPGPRGAATRPSPTRPCGWWRGAGRPRSSAPATA